jgi:hypothetical protein
MIGFFLDDKHDQSMGRLITFIGAVNGSVCIVSGIVLSFIEIVKKTNTSVGASLVLSGLGVFGVGSGLKYVSKIEETKQLVSDKSYDLDITELS